MQLSLWVRAEESSEVRQKWGMIGGMKTVKVAELTVENVAVTVRWKRIRNTYLRVKRGGQVELSVPARTSVAQATGFIADRVAWVKDHLAKLEPPRQFTAGEVHFLWGEPRTLVLTGTHELSGQLLVPASPGEHAERALYHRYQTEVAARVPALLHRWVSAMGVPLPTWSVRRMTSRWGSCTKARKRISLNSELARYRPELLEYVVVHELAHLIEANHSPKYYAILDRHLPGWRTLREELRHPPRQ